MKSAVYLLSGNRWIGHLSNNLSDDTKAQLVLCFGPKKDFIEFDIFSTLQQKFSSAQLVMCSTAGEIYQDTVTEDSIIAIAFQFEKTGLFSTSVNIADFSSSYDAAIQLADNLPKKDLSYVLVFSDGSLVNGSKLVNGLNAALGKKILVTGGLAGDGTNFKSTLLGLNGTPAEGKIVAIGFYGKNIIIKHGSQGGSDSFGLEKKITKSSDNVLYELEDQNALELYKKYLGAEAKNLPGAALLYPLSLIVPGTTQPVVRTILTIDEISKSMTFSGDVPEGSKVRFMKSEEDKLIKSASIAAQQTLMNIRHKPDFALLISCVGRKLLLKSRIKEEVEAVKNVYGSDIMMAGFYSYGEISPADDSNECHLHNQTMTITSFFET
jgi:hypothetical protein